MIKSIVVHDIPIDAVPAMERSYRRDHSAEIALRYGPWLARHESYLPLDAPADARAFGLYNWRVTEAWWRALCRTPGGAELHLAAGVADGSQLSRCAPAQRGLPGRPPEAARDGGRAPAHATQVPGGRLARGRRTLVPRDPHPRDHEATRPVPLLQPSGDPGADRASGSVAPGGIAAPGFVPVRA